MTKPETTLESHLKVKFLTWASDTISVVAETEVAHDPKLAHSIQNLAGRLREFAIAIAARECGSAVLGFVED